MPIPIPNDSIADPAASVRGLHVRFTVLTPRLLRLEHDPAGQFEDRPSQVFWHRRQPVPPFDVRQSSRQIEIETEHLRLRYLPQARGFTRATLTVELKATGTVWRYGDSFWKAGNLMGTARTLDETSGPVVLEPGLMSRAGWAVVDDSRSLVFDASGWLAPRPDSQARDLYFFSYGRDFIGCLQDFCKIAGAVPLIPRWALGNWWSRYWEYSRAELTGLMMAFRQREVPLSVCIVDMDWHITETGNTSSGWTGYTWNRGLFPDPEGFIAWLHAQGLQTALNLHPAEGVHPHEAQYARMAEHMGVDPASGEPIPFDIADPKFARGYFEILHHPAEASGVDFWWLDWQQGKTTKLPGLDPLWWLNHLHFYDLGRDGRKRPFIFSRWGGLGNHRYPIGFSGDTHVAWEALAFQPYFTATAANVGYGWWSHDIGGHMGGVEDRELYTRWVQFGVFSPILRLHSTKNPYHERRPWAYDAEVFRITREAMQLRHALIPYVYTMAWRNHTQSLPLSAPMYYHHPEDDEAYRSPNQYYFGSELVAAPFTSPADPDTRLSRQPVWLPPGDWFDFFTGECFAGEGWRVVYGGLDDIPVLAKAGAIVPLGPKVGWGGVTNPATLTVVLFPGADNRFELYEDDGETVAYQRGHFALTAFAQAWRGHALRFTIAPVTGDATLIPARREFQLVIRGIARPDRTELLVNGAPCDVSPAYDETTETLTLAAFTLEATDECALTLAVDSGSLLSKRDRTLETARKLLRAFRLETPLKHQIDQDLPRIVTGEISLSRYGPALKDAPAGALTSLVKTLKVSETFRV